MNGWCIDTPEFLYPDRKIAKFKDGYEANFVVYQQNPLQQIETVKTPTAVYKKGERLK